MKTIYKHRFNDAQERFFVGTVRHVGCEQGRDLPTIWIEHDADMMEKNASIPMEQYMFVGTGGRFDDSKWDFIGSAQCGMFVWHVFKARKVPKP